MELFKGQKLIEVSKRFKTDEDCKEYLAKIKWKKGYELNLAIIEIKREIIC